MEDEEIVALYLNRQESAITESAAKYGPALRALAQGILDNRQDVEECENDAYLDAWRSIPPQEPRTYLFAYLARLMRHRALDRYRLLGRKKRSALVTELTAELASCLPAPGGEEAQLQRMEFGRLLSAFLRAQSPVARAVFVRRYWYCDSVGEIASRFSLGESRVKSSLHRTRAKLKAYLEQEGFTW